MCIRDSGIIQDVTASVREAIAANPANVMDLAGDTIPRTCLLYTSRCV